MVYEIKQNNLLQYLKKTGNEIGFKNILVFSLSAVLFLTISVTFVLIQKRQDIRQRAAGTTIITVPITYNAIDDLYYKDLTLIAKVGSVSSASVVADGATIPSFYNSSTGELVFTTTSTSVNLLLNDLANPSAVTVTKAPLKYNKRWAWSHGMDDNVNLWSGAADSSNSIGHFIAKGYRATVFLIGDIVDTATHDVNGNPAIRNESWILDEGQIQQLINLKWGIGNHDYTKSCTTASDIQKNADIVLGPMVARSSNPGYKLLTFAEPNFDSSCDPQVKAIQSTTNLRQIEGGNDFEPIAENYFTSNLYSAPTLNSQWQEISPPGVSKDFNNPPNNYGFNGLVIDPRIPGTVYVGTNYQGLYKSTDSGNSWSRVDKAWNPGCGSFSEGRLWALALDKFNGALYAANGYGCGQGLLKSVDGGVNWKQMFPSSILSQATPDIYSITTDPGLANHVLVSFHGGWAGGSDAGVAESFDGGATWALHNPQSGWGAGHYVFFMGNSQTWLLTTQGAGMWRTTNSGSTWTKVSTANMMHGAASIYRSGNWWYVTTSKSILRSNDNGATWSVALNSSVADGFNSIIGDGVNLYTRTANTGSATSGPLPYLTSSENNGTQWTAMTQTYSNGPMYMAYDPVNHYIFSSNWNAGVFRLQTNIPAPLVKIGRDGGAYNAAHVKAEFDSISQRSTPTSHIWYNTLTHSDGVAVKDYLTYFDTKYGKNGNDEAWMAPSDEVYSYLLVRDRATIGQLIIGTDTPTPPPNGTPTSTPLPTTTNTPIPSSTPTPTRTPTPTPTRTPTPTPTRTPTPTLPPAPSATNTPTPIQTSTPTPTQLPSATPTKTPAQKADFNNNGIVDIQDLSYLLTRWGSGDLTADIDGDGSIGIIDLSILLSNWG